MPPLTETVEISLPITQIFLLGAYVLIAIYVVYTAILYYHWTNYASNAKVTYMTLLTYFGATLPLIAIVIVFNFLI